MDRPVPRYRWQLRRQPDIEPALASFAERRGISPRLVRLLAARGHTDERAIVSFLDPSEARLHDPLLLPDAEPFAERVRLAVERAERVLIFGDFDADGLTGLAVLVLALRRVGLDVEPYVPSRTEEGHGLSLSAVARAVEERRTLIVTVDCGTSSAAEIIAAREAGIDTLVTDHHHVVPPLPPALAVVNPHRPDSTYPDPRLAGSGVAFKLAQLLLGAEALELADLAAIGTVADVAPIVGENRVIVRLGLERLRQRPRPGLAALLGRAGVDIRRLDVERLAFAVAPRLNAVGRVGDAMLAALLLLSEATSEADALAEKLEAANVLRRELLASALDEARRAVDQASDDGSIAPFTIVSGDWPVGIIGLIAGRLAEERGRPAVVFSNSVEPWRGSARSAGGFDLAASFSALADLFERFGGHAAAAGCNLPAGRYTEFVERMGRLGETLRATEPELLLDLVVPSADVDYDLLRELALLDPVGPGNPPALVGVAGVTVVRVRAARGGHTQLVLRKGREVVDGVCFGRDDLAAELREGDQLDLVARLASRTFGGYESLQLEIRDAAAAGALDRLLPRQAALVA